MLGLGDVSEEDGAHVLWVDLVDIDDHEGHEDLVRLDEEAWRHFVVRDTERVERQEWVERIAGNDAAVVDLVQDDVGRARRMQSERECRHDDEDAEDRVPEYERYRRYGEGDDADRPVPVGLLLDVEVCRRIPGDERIRSHAEIIAPGLRV